MVSLGCHRHNVSEPVSRCCDSPPETSIARAFPNIGPAEASSLLMLETREKKSTLLLLPELHAATCHVTAHQGMRQTSASVQVRHLSSCIYLPFLQFKRASFSSESLYSILHQLVILVPVTFFYSQTLTPHFQSNPLIQPSKCASPPSSPLLPFPALSSPHRVRDQHSTLTSPN